MNNQISTVNNKWKTNIRGIHDHEESVEAEMSKSLTYMVNSDSACMCTANLVYVQHIVSACLKHSQHVTEWLVIKFEEKFLWQGNKIVLWTLPFR
jgi:hypothetical protein